MANVPTTSWAESSPAGSDLMSTVDNRIREMKTQVREVVGVDHDFPSSGQASDNGQHLRVTLQEQADLGTGEVGATILGSQTISGKGELVYTTEADVDIQITKDDKIHAPSLGGVYPAASVAVLATMMNLIYPVGSIYANKTDSTNPGTLLGVGTWSAVEEQVIVGYKVGSTYFGTPGASVGADTTTLTAAQSGLPAHTHSYVGAGHGDISGPVDNTDGVSATTGSTGGTDASQAHSNIQQSLVCYVWVRTA